MNLCLFEKKLIKKLNRKKKRILVNDRKFYRRSQLKRREQDWQRVETFCQRKTSESFDNVNKLSLTSFVAVYSAFFPKDQRKKNVSDFEPDTVSKFQTTPSLYWWAKTYSALSFGRINILNMAHLRFWLHFQLVTLCNCFREPKKTLK